MTDIARDRQTDKIISAIELWQIEGIHNERFECHACGVTLLPASFDKPVNKKRPYFRLFGKTDHDEDCGAERAKKVKGKARTQSVTTEEGFPYPHPNRLVLADEAGPTPATGGGIIVCPVRTPGPAPDEPRGKEGTSRPRKVHNHTTNTIRPLAQTYLDYPFDREHLSLTVPVVRGVNYEEVFRYLFYTEDSSFPEPKIFYGSIRFSKIRVLDDFAEVELSEGRWEKVEGRNRLVRPQVVRINMKGWPELMRTSLLDELEVTRRESIEANARGDKKTKGWLFFLGRQDPLDKFLFHVGDHRLVCCFADEMVRKSKPVPYRPPAVKVSPGVKPEVPPAPPRPEATAPKVEAPRPLSASGGAAPTQPARTQRIDAPGAVTRTPRFPQATQVKKHLVARDKELPLPREATDPGARSNPAPAKALAPDAPARDSGGRPTAIRRVRLWLRRLAGKS